MFFVIFKFFVTRWGCHTGAVIVAVKMVYGVKRYKDWARVNAFDTTKRGGET